MTQRWRGVDSNHQFRESRHRCPHVDFSVEAAELVDLVGNCSCPSDGGEVSEKQFPRGPIAAAWGAMGNRSARTYCDPTGAIDINKARQLDSWRNRVEQEMTHDRAYFRNRVIWRRD